MDSEKRTYPVSGWHLEHADNSLFVALMQLRDECMGDALNPLVHHYICQDTAIAVLKSDRVRMLRNNLVNAVCDGGRPYKLLVGTYPPNWLAGRTLNYSLLSAGEVEKKMNS